jgi:AhpD family alkylhydroperoxidase
MANGRFGRRRMPSVPSAEEFRRDRAEGNDRLRETSPALEEFFMLDAAAYEAGALPVATKELLGLVASLMKDCEECVYYHLERCDAEGVRRDQVLETMHLALVAGGSVTVPLLRKAVAFMAELPRLKVQS